MCPFLAHVHLHSHQPPVSQLDMDASELVKNGEKRKVCCFAMFFIASQLLEIQIVFFQSTTKVMHLKYQCTILYLWNFIGCIVTY